jgi:hypothetical protein
MMVSRVQRLAWRESQRIFILILPQERRSDDGVHSEIANYAYSE